MQNINMYSNILRNLSISLNKSIIKDLTNEVSVQSYIKHPQDDLQKFFMETLVIKLLIKLSNKMHIQKKGNKYIT